MDTALGTVPDVSPQEVEFNFYDVADITFDPDDERDPVCRYEEWFSLVESEQARIAANTGRFLGSAETVPVSLWISLIDDGRVCGVLVSVCACACVCVFVH